MVISSINSSSANAVLLFYLKPYWLSVNSLCFSMNESILCWIIFIAFLRTEEAVKQACNLWSCVCSQFYMTEWFLLFSFSWKFASFKGQVADVS